MNVSKVYTESITTTGYKATLSTTEDESPFVRVLEEIKALHDRKQADYGTDEDPFANVRASERFGIRPWVGALVRLNDKITRLQTFIRKGRLMNESVEDSLMDIAVYAIIALVLYREDAAA
jgi:hypothetical protein